MIFIVCHSVSPNILQGGQVKPHSPEFQWSIQRRIGELLYGVTKKSRLIVIELKGFRGRIRYLYTIWCMRKKMEWWKDSNSVFHMSTNRFFLTKACDNHKGQGFISRPL
ncbi:hypothetical protein M9H77_23128 [Catharanthus roseus]|uniref:Uncharacterized protein n=1 Tax=Catharanthus roseus TaxID=4058 RepID=A0ACC0ASD8_CATRO|nr:hypothetical protein M9H77_23128 [Catharanthus roseus]